MWRGPPVEDGALNILLTRPRAQAEALARILAAEGWTPVVCPLLTYAPLDVVVDPGDAAALVFTSANGVRASGLAGFDGPVYVVGAATAEAARSAGFGEVVASDGDAADLALLMLARGERGPALHLRGRHVAGELGAVLTKAGVGLSESVIYEMRAVETFPDEVRGMIAGGKIAVVPFYSPRSARVFAGIVDEEVLKGLAATSALAISHDVAKPLRKLGFAEVVVAAAPTGAAMLEAIRGMAPLQSAASQ